MTSITDFQFFAKDLAEKHPDLDVTFSWGSEPSILLDTKAVVPRCKPRPADEEHFAKNDSRWESEAETFWTRFHIRDGIPSAEKVDQITADLRTQLATARQETKTRYRQLCEKTFVEAFQRHHSVPIGFRSPLLDSGPRTSTSAPSRDPRPVVHIETCGAIKFVALWVEWEDDHVIVTEDDISTLPMPMESHEFQGVRQAVGMTRQEFAQALNPESPIQERAITRWEKGERDIPEGIAAKVAQIVTVTDELTEAIAAETLAKGASAHGWVTVVTHESEKTMPEDLTADGVTPAMHRKAAFRAWAALRKGGYFARVSVWPEPDDAEPEEIRMSWSEIRQELWQLISDDIAHMPDGFYGDIEAEDFDAAHESFEDHVADRIWEDQKGVFFAPDLDLDAAFDVWKREVWPHEKA